MIYSEAAFPFADNPTPNHCQHCADRDEHNRLKAKEPKALPRMRRPYDRRVI